MGEKWNLMAVVISGWIFHNTDYNKGLKEECKGKKRGLQLWGKCTTQLAQCLSISSFQCADPLYLWVISQSPRPASRRGDLNSQTGVRGFEILSILDIGSSFLADEDSLNRKKTGWMTVTRFRQWTCCWLRNGLWQPPCFNLVSLSRNSHKEASLTGTCES